MNKYLLTAALLLCSCVPASAGTAGGGIKAGMNFSTFTGDDAENAYASIAARAAFTAGGYLLFPVRDMPFRIQAEALITSKGATYKWGTGFGTASETRYKLTYFEVPVLARFDFVTRSGAKPSLLVGPSFAIKLGASGESRSVEDGSVSADLDNVRTFDFGLAVGGMLEMQTSKGAITLEARYTHGLSKVFDSVNGRSSDIKNSCAAVMAGYRF